MTYTYDNILNLAPHSITIYDPAAPDRAEPSELYPAGFLPPSGEVARIDAEYGEAGPEVVLSDGLVSGCIGIPTRLVVYAGRIVGLPDPQPPMLYLVSLPVALAAEDRDDLVVVDREVRNPAGTVIGCRGLARVTNASAPAFERGWEAAVRAAGQDPQVHYAAGFGQGQVFERERATKGEA